MMIKKVAIFLVALVTSVSGLAAPIQTTALSGSEFNPGRIMDDSVFYAANTMSANNIQAFLNAKVPTCDSNGTQAYGATTRAAYAASRGVSTPFICLKDFHTSIPAKAAETGLCNGITASGATAAEIISWVSTSCGINPQVLIVLLQKEQSLITDDWPWPVQYRSATGYGCPDTAPCDAEYYGFFNQVYHAARQFKRYAKDSNLFSYKAGFNNFVQYNPDNTTTDGDPACGGSTVYIENQATASLYNYTPYQPNAAALANLYGTGDDCSAYGNRNFWRMFNDWFGPTLGPPDYSCKFATNVPTAATGPHIVANTNSAGANSSFSLTMPNNTGTGCIEIHTWGNNQQAWVSNIATNHPAIDPSDGEIISANVHGDNKSEMVFVKYKNTGSGRIELHVWDASLQRWSYNIATNHPSVDPADARVISGDMNGDGRDEIILVKYKNTGSGRIEIHTWAPGQQTWRTNVATNYPESSPSDFRVISANQYGDSADELSLVKYRNSGSGKIEIHTWGNNQQAWVSNIATNHPMVDPADIEIMSGRVYGEGIDQIVLVKYRNTGSGRMEVHTWAPQQQVWYSNIATNYGQVGL